MAQAGCWVWKFLLYSIKAKGLLLGYIVNVCNGGVEKIYCSEMIFILDWTEDPLPSEQKEHWCWQWALWVLITLHLFMVNCSSESPILEVGEELEWERLSLVDGSNREYRVLGLRERKWYEVKISYPASVCLYSLFHIPSLECSQDNLLALSFSP